MGKKLAKKIWTMFGAELIKKMQSNEFEEMMAKKLADKIDLKDKTEEEEVIFFKNIADCCTDSIASLMGGKAD
tara:strand:+ start:1948 stop:2166 length:219 start_codon:yes stop_codon:yes gene_type:complete